MAIDKNLFLYDLSIVAILKNEAPYLREWLDYHLMAGVDHFYLYDNESTDNQAEVAAPYVEAGIVDYIPVPGEVMQTPVYNDAVNRFKFQSRYMAFIDCDEFIYPKSNRRVVDIVDEILLHDPNAAG
ncbi:MAG: glycosyltransferase family 92 protein, partial [Selenomonadaceae bacterium]|nr:glycosyltransferase family 92 protein [Selenomonadaceae bacterium]